MVKIECECDNCEEGIEISEDVFCGYCYRKAVKEKPPGPGTRVCHACSWRGCTTELIREPHPTEDDCTVAKCPSCGMFDNIYDISAYDAGDTWLLDRDKLLREQSRLENLVESLNESLANAKDARDAAVAKLHEHSECPLLPECAAAITSGLVESASFLIGIIVGWVCCCICIHR